MTSYLRKRGRKFHFRKRVPGHLRGIFSKDVIQIPLGTDSEALATQRASSFNLVLEEFCAGLAGASTDEIRQKLESVVLKSKMDGFRFIPREELVQETPLPEFINRINIADSLDGSIQKAVVLGGIQPPSVKISKVKNEYFQHEEVNLGDRSENQLRKWRNPRNKAVKNFIKVVGDKPMNELTRDDILQFRTWWTKRMKEGELAANSANKEFGFLKQIIDFAIHTHSLDISLEKLFRDIRLRETEKTVRYPFTSEFIQNELLKPGTIGLNEEARLLIFAMADTGARIAELTGLEKEDIFLDAEIPHIKIRPNKTRSLKTPQSERDLPLVGASLYAFKALGGTFRRYHGKPDLISSVVNKYYRDNGLFPSENHSLYSMRHSFEDRLTAVEPPDKVQAAMMGHKYFRPRYGLGPTLEQKKLWLDKIAFKVE